jgi:hypothetical protein
MIDRAQRGPYVVCLVSKRAGIVGAASLALLLLAGCDPEDRGKERPEAPEATPPADAGGIRIVKGPTLSDHPLLSDQARALPPSGAAVPAGLERQDWTIATYGNPGQLLSVPLPGKTPAATERPVRLALELFGGAAYSTAITLEGSWNLSVTGEATTTLLIYNASRAALQGSLAYSLSAACVWYESQAFVLKPGWNSVQVRQGTADFKTRSSDWQHTAGLWHPEDCRSITLLFHNGQRTGRLFIDSIRITETRASGARPPPRSVFQSPK